MKQLISIFKPAFRGISLFVKSERNASFHVVAALLSLTAALLLQMTWDKLGWVILAVVLVFVTEMMNTAIEKLCNKVEPHLDPQIKDIKDIAAGAVLLAALFALVVALAVVLPAFLKAIPDWFQSNSSPIKSV